MDKKKKPHLKKELEKCNEEKEEYINGWKRSKADLINYKRDEAIRIGALLKERKKDLMLKIISVMDSFDRAVEIGEENTFLEGFLKIKEQLSDVLKKEGVELLDCVGEEFDPSFHEVVEGVKKEGVESGIIVEELQKGYKMDGDLLRPSKVKVVL